jgi:hypothetical protein
MGPAIDKSVTTPSSPGCHEKQTGPEPSDRHLRHTGSAFHRSEETDHRDHEREYGLPDAAKALRVVLDHAMLDADEDEIFGTVRCRRCG